MTDSIADLLGKRQFEEPPEIKQVQAFVQAQFKATSEVMATEKQITISVKGSALAGALRQLLPQLQNELQTTKRLVIRIK